MAKITHVRVVMNRAGAKDVLNADGVLRELERRAQLIADAAGGAPDYVVVSKQGGARARAAVTTATIRGRAGEAKDRRLSNALNAGRG